MKSTKKRKLLFILPNFHIGGTVVSTRNLISLLDIQRFDITIWALEQEGLLASLYKDIPQIRQDFISQALSQKSWRSANTFCKKIAAGIIRLLANNSMAVKKSFIKLAIRNSLNGRKYDTVIACQEAYTSLFASSIPCRKRVAWVRCDYKRYFDLIGKKKENFYYLFDNIVCVSKKTRDNFNQIYPELKERTYNIYNPQNSELIKMMSTQEGIDIDFDARKKNFLSIGRLDPVKRFSHIPSIARQLRDKGLNFHWYIIGEGPERAKIAAHINLQQVSDCVSLLGARSNPYPFLRKADLYICLSSSEACPRVINEAKILGTPVVATDFDTIYEYITDHVDGMIAPIHKLADTILCTMQNEQLYSILKENINTFRFDNDDSMSKIESIL